MATSVRGVFFSLYLIVDIYSRKIVGPEVFEAESAAYAARLVQPACLREGMTAPARGLHADNGAPLKGATRLATWQRLGGMPSFSRPSVSDDNPYSEALFRTLNYQPRFPAQPFEILPEARDWVWGLQRWDNHQHNHSALNFITPAQRHHGAATAVLAQRKAA